MKKNLLTFVMIFMFLHFFKAQCVYTCSNYAVSQISYSAFPTSGTNVISQLSPSIDDGITSPIFIGFNFDFYCTTYNSVLICSNGFLQFNIGSPPSLTFANPAQFFPNVASPNGLVALNMNDFDPSAGGTITYTTVGTSPNQMFIVTYSNVPIWYDAINNIPSSPVYNSGQIVLYETTNIIEIHSASIGLSPYLGTQGIENATGTLGSAVVGRNNAMWSTNNSAYRWSPYSITPPVSITGSTSVCQGSSNLYQTNFIASASAYNWTFPAGWTGTGTTSIVTPTAGLSGNIQVTATYSCGTSLPASLYVNVIPNPIVSITSAAPSVLCSGSAVTFYGSGAATYTLNPSGLNGVPPFSDVPASSTSYTLTGTSSAGCISQNSPTTFITVNPTPTININSGSICIGKSFTLNPTGASIYTLSSTFPIVTPTVVGVNSYSVTGTSTNNCLGNMAVSNITVFALPTITASTTRSVICLNESTSITASGASTYTWNTSALNSIVTVSPTSTTAYTVTGTDVNGCVNSATCSVKVSACVGIEQLSDEQSDMRVFPNPTHGLVTVEVNELDGSVMIEVYNSLGQLVICRKVDDHENEIDLKNYANGLYYFKLGESGKEKMLKIIKE